MYAFTYTHTWKEAFSQIDKRSKRRSQFNLQATKGGWYPLHKVFVTIACNFIFI